MGGAAEAEVVECLGCGSRVWGAEWEAHVGRELAYAPWGCRLCPPASHAAWPARRDALAHSRADHPDRQPLLFHLPQRSKELEAQRRRRPLQPAGHSPAGPVSQPSPAPPAQAFFSPPASVAAQSPQGPAQQDSPSPAPQQASPAASAEPTGGGGGSERCSECGGWVGGSESRVAHLLRAHVERKVGGCAECGWEAGSLGEVRAHIAQRHPTSQREPVDQRWLVRRELEEWERRCFPAQPPAAAQAPAAAFCRLCCKEVGPDKAPDHVYHHLHKKGLSRFRCPLCAFAHYRAQCVADHALQAHPQHPHQRQPLKPHDLALQIRPHFDATHAKCFATA